MITYAKRYFTILILSLSNFLFSQESVEDSLINTICINIPDYKNLNDKEKLKKIMNDHLKAYILTKEPIKRDSIYKSVESRLQRKCDEYMQIRDRLYIPKPGNWDYLEKIPTSKLTNEEVEEFKNIENFYYIQKDRMKVNVTIKNNEWKDLFPDNTYSRLNFEWLTKTSFQIKFIESNNIGRKGASRKGDKYVYHITERKNDFYKLVLTNSQNNRIVSFNFYPLKK